MHLRQKVNCVMCYARVQELVAEIHVLDERIVSAEFAFKRAFESAYRHEAGGFVFEELYERALVKEEEYLEVCRHISAKTKVLVELVGYNHAAKLVDGNKKGN